MGVRSWFSADWWFNSATRRLLPLLVQVWVGTGCQKITDDLSSIPESLPVTNKDLSDLASIRSIPQVTGLFGQMESGSYYYKRVTFLTCAMPCDFLKFGSIPAPNASQNKDLLDLSLIGPNAPGIWAIWSLMLTKKKWTRSISRVRSSSQARSCPAFGMWWQCHSKIPLSQWISSNPVCKLLYVCDFFVILKSVKKY